MVLTISITDYRRIIFALGIVDYWCLSWQLNELYRWVCGCIWKKECSPNRNINKDIRQVYTLRPYLGKQEKTSFRLKLSLIPFTNKQVSKQELDINWWVCIVGIFYICISAVPTSEQLLGEKKTCAKFKFDVSKTERLVLVYTGGLTWLIQLSSTRWSFMYIFCRVSHVSFCVQKISSIIMKFIDKLNISVY